MKNREFKATTTVECQAIPPKAGTLFDVSYRSAERGILIGDLRLAITYTEIESIPHGTYEVLECVPGAYFSGNGSEGRWYTVRAAQVGNIIPDEHV